MKTRLLCLLAGASLCLLSQQLPAATFSGHYPTGAEGLKGASLPPPGFYFRDYNLFYFANRFPGGPPDFDAFGYINAPRFLWMTDCKLLGADYGMDFLLPFYYGKVEFPGYSDDTFGMADLLVEPLLLSWHLKQFDFSAAYGLWMPTGDYNEDRRTRLSRILPMGFYTHMLTAGVTWYPDEEKTWAVSALNRYEIHMEQNVNNFTAGNTYTLEWGISKSLKKTIDVGIVGYYQQQTSNYDPVGAGPMDQIAGIGPEVSMFCSKLGLFTSIRYVREFAAQDRPEGNTITLTLTKRW